MQEVAKPGKRKGPLPLWLAEVLLLASFGGLGFAVVKYGAVIEKAANTAGDTAAALYEKVFPTPSSGKQ